MLVLTQRRFIVPNSFADLNDYAGGFNVEYTDNRPAKVVFDRPTSLINDVQLNITSTVVNILPPIEIVEIINYTIANVRLRVEIKSPIADPLTGSTIEWDTLPGGSVLSQLGNVYTLSGINNITDWNIVRDFHWNLPANYATKKLWFLDVSIIYFDEATSQDVTVNWQTYDPDFYYFATLECSFSINTSGLRRRRGITQSMPSSFNFYADQGIEKRSPANLVVTSSVFCSGDDRSFANAVLRNFAVIGATGTRRRPFANKNLLATSSLTFGNNTNTFKQISNFINVSRNWLGNQPNQIFASTTPNFNLDGQTGATYSITISVSSGTIGTSLSSSSSYSFSGTKDQVNAAFSPIFYYPNKDASPVQQFLTLAMTRNGQVLPSYTISLNYAGAGSIPQNIYTILPLTQQYTTIGQSQESRTWTPTELERKYGRFDYALVGGGTFGDNGSYGTSFVTRGTGGRGGSSGGVVVVTNQPINQTSFTFTIGRAGYIGGNTTYGGNTAYGGDRNTSGASFNAGASGGAGGGGGGGAGATANGAAGQTQGGTGAGGAGGAGYALPWGGVAAVGGGGGNAYDYSGGGSKNGFRGATNSAPGSGGGGGGGLGGPSPNGGGGAGQSQASLGQPGGVIIRVYS